MLESQRKTILGLDLGSNSIGWALIEQDFDAKTGMVIKAGTRIIPIGQDELGKFDAGISVSRTAERTNFRSIRRLRERSLLRRERLHRALNIIGFLPAHYAALIDFDKRYGQFLPETEPKIAYAFDPNTNKAEFIFNKSFEEMLEDFRKHQPSLVENGKKVPYDWTIYYLRKKALTRKIEKEELAWILLNFNQKRGYYQLRGEDEEENMNKLVEFHSLLVTKVEDSGDRKGKDEVWYNVHLENGWIYRRTSKTMLDWAGKRKDFIVTTELNADGTVKTDKEGKEKRSFRAPAEDDWNLLKKKTEYDIEQSSKTVGTYIYDTLLQKPDQKIKGKLVKVVERKFYKEELLEILKRQSEFHPELKDQALYRSCIEDLYPRNDGHRSNLSHKDFIYLFLNDIIFYQRPLKSKKSLISNCNFERKFFVRNGETQIVPVKCIAKSHPLYQEFRLWKFVQNLRIYQREKVLEGRLMTDVDVTPEFLKNEEDIVALFEWLNDKKEIDQKSFLKYPPFNIKKDISGYRWNYVEDKTYPCNETRAQIMSRLEKVEGIPADFLTSEREEALWHILYSVKDKTEIQKALRSFSIKNNLGEDFVEQFKKIPPFDGEYGAYSAKAIRKFLSLMRMGKYWKEVDIPVSVRERIDKILSGEFDKTIRKRAREKTILLNDLSDFKGLPEWLASYIIYDRHSEDAEMLKWKSPEDIAFFLRDRFRQHSLRNPIVEQVVSETLRVVHDIWKDLGKGREDFFDEIHIELGREMKNPAEKRKQIASQISENENTNLRIKALLTELLNDKSIENVRPYSPAQQEALKIYEEGVLNAEENIPDDILKISRMAQPSKAELIRYKLWLQQGYTSPYTGNIIPLGKLFTHHYEIEHIIPRSRYFDDSFSNKVICESAVNKDKGNCTALEYIIKNGGAMIEPGVKILERNAYEKNVLKNYSGHRSKMKKLLMEDIPEDFIMRQLNDTRYISKAVKNLLSNIVREREEQEMTSKNVVVVNGSITSALKQDWGLNDIWNDLIIPRFERLNALTNSSTFGEWTNKNGKQVFQVQVPLEHQKGFSKKRIDHRHHALDAIVIASATKNHVNYLNNENALEKNKSKEEKEKKRYDLRQRLCIKKFNDDSNKNYKWTFDKPWPTFAQDVAHMLENIVVSFKQNLRVINNTGNRYQKWVKEEEGEWVKKSVAQNQGSNWAIRKPLHKYTVSGEVMLKLKKTVSLNAAIDNIHMIVDKGLKLQMKELYQSYPEKKSLLKHLKDKGFSLDGRDVSKMEIYYWDTDKTGKPGNVASRVSIDEKFDSSKIESITDTGIQKIMLRHLQKYNEEKNGKITERPDLAFSPEGIEEMNKNILELNNCRMHKPIYKVRTFEPKGNKFNVGYTGNKKSKFVEAAKGTNLYFAVYSNDDGKRVYETIPLNIVIERLKQRLSPVPEMNEAGDSLIFYLSPNDLVFVPEENEVNNKSSMDFNALTKDQVSRIYKTVSFTGNQCFFVRNDIANPIVNKFEFSALNKMERSIEGVMIKEICVKLKVSRLGKIEAAI